MDYCWWLRMEPAREVGQGSAAVPGRRMQAVIARAEADNPGAWRPDVDSDIWSETANQGIFCSRTRPAIQNEDGWLVLPLPSLSGASEGISNMYLHVCHPGRGDDPYTAVQGLDFAVPSRLHLVTFSSFEELIAR